MIASGRTLSCRSSEAEYLRANRHSHRYIFRAAAGAILAAAVSAVLGREAWGVIKIDEIIGVLVGHEHNVAAFAAVAAIGAATVNVFLASEGDASIPAIPRLGVNSDFVYKHRAKNTETAAESLRFLLHEHLEGAAHEFRVEELVDGLALLAELTGSALDDLCDLRFSDLQQEMRLVGEQHRFEAESLAPFD
jgi:hypothetical protein